MTVPEPDREMIYKCPHCGALISTLSDQLGHWDYNSGFKRWCDERRHR